jgi:hypothetical protein
VPYEHGIRFEKDVGIARKSAPVSLPLEDARFSRSYPLTGKIWTVIPNKWRASDERTA